MPIDLRGEGPVEAVADVLMELVASVCPTGGQDVVAASVAGGGFAALLGFGRDTDAGEVVANDLATALVACIRSLLEDEHTDGLFLDL